MCCKLPYHTAKKMSQAAVDMPPKKSKKRRTPRFMSFSNIKMESHDRKCIKRWERCILPADDKLRYYQMARMATVKDGRIGKTVIAAQNIPNHTVLGWYKGDVYEEYDPRAIPNYCVDLPRQEIGGGLKQYWLDGSKWLHRQKCNIIFINHSCESPNCIMDSVPLTKTIKYVDSEKKTQSKTITAFYILATTTRLILKGEEILSNYDGQGCVAKNPSGDYFFDTKKKQERLMKKHNVYRGDTVEPCMCTPEGCPLKYFFIKSKVDTKISSDVDAPKDSSDYDDLEYEEQPEDDGESKRRASVLARPNRYAEREEKKRAREAKEDDDDD